MTGTAEVGRRLQRSRLGAWVVNLSALGYCFYSL